MGAKPSLEVYLESFYRYKQLTEKSLAKIEDDAFYWKYNERSNSLAQLVKHLGGNMISRWTDFRTSDGEKDWRKRDREFEVESDSRKSIMLSWQTGWLCLEKAFSSMEDQDLQSIVYVRGEAHTVEKAMLRQLAHLSYHVGQIVFLSKMLTDENWISLTIPFGQSEQFNRTKFEENRGTPNANL